jgi:hypothetical protein
MTEPNFRALCAQLCGAIATQDSKTLNSIINQTFDKTVNALAQPEPQGPTESDLSELFYRHVGEGSEVGFQNAIAEALARWGRPAIEPMPQHEVGS